MKWYYIIKGVQQGPVSDEQIKALINSCELLPGDYVWHEGMGEWEAISQVPELRNLDEPGLSTSRSSNPYVAVGAQVDELAVSGFERDGFTGYASFGRRLVALLVDSLVLFGIGSILGLLLGPILVESGAEGVSEDRLAADVLGLLIGWLYYGLMESSIRQATVGKMAMGIRVTDLNGDRISFARATGRHFGKILSGLILLVGYLMMLWSPRKQTLHDLMAGCLVTRSH